MTTAPSSRETSPSHGAGMVARWLGAWGARQRRAADELFPPRIDALTGRPASKPFPTPYY
jgi:hypothetical protein